MVNKLSPEYIQDFVDMKNSNYSIYRIIINYFYILGMREKRSQEQGMALSYSVLPYLTNNKEIFNYFLPYSTIKKSALFCLSFSTIKNSSVLLCSAIFNNR